MLQSKSTPPAADARHNAAATQTPPGLAPIALFVYNRPEHTRRCLDSLMSNPDYLSSPLYIFCDGPRARTDRAAVEAIRGIVQACPHPRKIVRQASVNQGLANSVIAGISTVLAAHDQVIVVEDDLIVGPSFLSYLNRSLQRYRDIPRVMQIAAHMYPVDPCTTNDAFFLPLASSWGWATWRRAWQHFDPLMLHYGTLCRDEARRRQFNLDAQLPYFEFLQRQHAGRADSWFIRWYLSIFMNDGLVLYPRHSHVKNRGFDGTGVHCGVGGSPYDASGPLPTDFGSRLPEPIVSDEALQAVRQFLGRQNRWHARGLRRARATAHAWLAKLNATSPG